MWKKQLNLPRGQYTITTTPLYNYFNDHNVPPHGWGCVVKVHRQAQTVHTTLHNNVMWWWVRSGTHTLRCHPYDVQQHTADTEVRVDTYGARGLDSSRILLAVNDLFSFFFLFSSGPGSENVCQTP